MQAKIFSVLLAALMLLSAIAVYAASGRERVFTGVVIHLTDTAIEVKRGRREFLISITPRTVYCAADGSAADRSVLELCGTVRVYYVQEGCALHAVRVQLVREGECYRR